MPRDLPLANGHLLVNFDSKYNLRDFYWPHIGQRNQTSGHVNHMGIWIDGAFAWLDDPAWERSLVYEPDTLVTQVALTHPGLRVRIDCADVVDFDRDIFLRRARVTNLADTPREVRLFYHQDWHLGESEGANTVYYRPDLRAVIAYKDRCNILVNGLVGEKDCGSSAEVRQADVGVTHWATGYKEFNGQQGTWVDAEDGELGGYPIAQGSVDSTVGFWLGTIAPSAARYCYSWMAVAADYRTVCNLNRIVVERGPESFLTRTRDYWKLWLSAKPFDGGDLPQPLLDLYKRSLLVVRTQIDADGAIIAATDGDVWTFARDSYAYMWPRDGSLVANVMSHAGYGDITGAFFDFCAKRMTDDGYLLHKYTPAGALGSSWEPWMDSQGNFALPIQEDETALVVYALWQHYTLFHEVEFIRPLYRPLVKNAAEFMVRYRDEKTHLPLPSWDLWEERRGIHAYTTAAVYAGLVAASKFADLFGEHEHAQRYATAAQEIQQAVRAYMWDEERGRYVRSLTVTPQGALDPDLTIDASVSGLYQFGMFPATDERVRKTMDAVIGRLTIKSDVGGIARYEDDRYHQVSQDSGNVPGNPWFICACWVAEYMIAKATTVDELHEALPWLEWAQTHALPSGVLAEQTNPYTNEPLSVSPLTWSHAEFAGAIRWYLGRHHHLGDHPTSVGATEPAFQTHP